MFTEKTFTSPPSGPSHSYASSPSPNGVSLHSALIGGVAPRVAAALPHHGPASSPVGARCFRNITKKPTLQGKSFKTCARCGLMARSNRQHACPPKEAGGCGAHNEWVKSDPKPRRGSKKRNAESCAGNNKKKKKTKTNTPDISFSKWLENKMSFSKLEASEFSDMSEFEGSVKKSSAPKLTRTPSLVPFDEYDESMFVDSASEILLKAEITERDNKIKELEEKAVEREQQMKKLQAEAAEREKKIKELLAQASQREMDLKLREVRLKRREIDLDKRAADLDDGIEIVRKETKCIADRKIELDCVESSLRKREADVNLCEVHASDEMFLLMNDALNDFPVNDSIEEDLDVHSFVFAE